jgi:hypothetical protein
MGIASISRISRVIVALAALFFAGVGLELWVAPERAAHRLGVEAVRESGVATLRADLGGLFVGLALLCGIAVGTRRRSWTTAAVLVLGAIVIGRSIGLVSSGRVGDEPIELAIELGVIAALLTAARDVAGDVQDVPPSASVRHRG